MAGKKSEGDSARARRPDDGMIAAQQGVALLPHFLLQYNLLVNAMLRQLIYLWVGIRIVMNLHTLKCIFSNYNYL